MNPFLRYPKAAFIYLGIFLRTAAGLVTGHIRWEFVKALHAQARLRHGSLLMSLMTTTACGRQCEHCIMGHLLRAYPGYHMGLDEVRSLIDAAERSGYRFSLMLTGGEPALWNHFKEGVLLLRRSRMCASLTVFTNASYPQPLLDAEVVAAVDNVRVSRYNDSNPAHVAALQQAYGCKVEVFDTSKFWPNPSGPVKGTIPAECLNYELFYFNRRVYACPHSASIACGNSSRVALSNPVSAGFLKGLGRIRHEQQEEICTWCISNNKVRTMTERVENFSGGQTARR